MYKYVIRPVFFLFEPEKIHHFVSKLLRTMVVIPGVKAAMGYMYGSKDKRLERKLFGLNFPNPVGLAAGFDKDAKMFRELSQLGFGFIEIGTITPLPQPGNPHPRMFRLPADKALVNRMGFNNQGADVAAQRLKNKPEGIIIGGNIGKNKDTPNEKALDDYLYCFNKLFDVIDYFVVNVSSPNTPGLRSLQEKEPLKNILLGLKKANATKEKPKPILLKIAPDLTNEQLDDIIEIVGETKIDGVIATNTTIGRGGLKSPGAKILKAGAGGLSGKPLRVQSTEVIKYLAEKSGKAFPIIGVGGIHSPEDAIEKMNAGADLVQLYTGFIYEGPGLVKRINQRLMTDTDR